MGSKSRVRSTGHRVARGRARAPHETVRFARGSSAAISPLGVKATPSAVAEPSDAIPVRADDVGAPFVRVVTELAEAHRTSALATWDAMCRVEQALRERRGS